MASQMHELANLSVVISTLNSRGLLEVSLPFWLNQGVREVVVVDGGSTDTSEEYVLSLAKGPTPIHLVKEHRRGLAVARNTGGRIASGDLVLHAGPDNTIPMDTLSSMIAALDAASLVSCRTRVETGSWYRDLCINVSKRRLAHGIDIDVVGTPYLGRRELFAEFAFDEQVEHSDDTFFCAEIRSYDHVIARVPEFCVEEGFETMKSLKSRYLRWGQSDAEYFVRIPKDTSFFRKVISFTRAFWVEVFSPMFHSPAVKYILAIPVLFVFGGWRFSGFLSSLGKVGPRSLRW